MCIYTYTYRHTYLCIYTCTHMHIHVYMYIHTCMCVCVPTRVQFFVTLWTQACQAPLSMEFSRQEDWSGLPFSIPGESSQARDWTCISCVSCIGRWILYCCTTRAYTYIYIELQGFIVIPKWMPFAMQWIVTEACYVQSVIQGPVLF